MLCDIRTGVAEQDAAKVGMAAHTLKGAVSAIAGNTVHETALVLETMARNKDLSAAPSACVALERALQQLRPYLAAELNTSSARGSLWGDTQLSDSTAANARRTCSSDAN